MQGSNVYGINEYLDSLAGLWCITLGLCKYNLSNVLFVIIYYSLQNFAIWYNICITICLFFLVLGRNI
jgi:hypothetical protein